MQRVTQRIHHLLVFSLIFFLNQPVANAAELTLEQTKAIKAEIKQLVDDYGYYRDMYDPQGWASVFSEDGKFTFRGQVYQGQEALAKRIEDSDQSSVSMHMMSSSHVEIQDHENATGVHYAAIYAKTPDESHEEGAIIPISGPAVIGKYMDKYVLTDNGWKISERMFRPVFNTAQ